MPKTILVSDALGGKHSISQDEIIPRVAIYGIFIKEGMVLMVNDSRSKRWEFPGGGVDTGESELDALKREIFEETGLTLNEKSLEPANLISSIEELFYDLTSQQAWHTRRKFYRVSSFSGSISDIGNGDDVTKVAFCEIGCLKNLVSPTVEKVINKMVDL
jgi:8-oxo-dGTP diphosphatase